MKQVQNGLGKARNGWNYAQAIWGIQNPARKKNGGGESAAPRGCEKVDERESETERNSWRRSILTDTIGAGWLVGR